MWVREVKTTPCDQPTTVLYLDSDGQYRMRLCKYHVKFFMEIVSESWRFIDPTPRQAALPCAYTMVEHEVPDWEAAHCTLPLWAFG